MNRSQPRYKPGDRIGGRYQVHDVKMGGMGEVYLCLDLEEMYPYALKTFQQRYQSTALRKAFEQEVTTWITLEKHPNIVRCHWMQVLDNQPFMGLEWIAGEEGKGADLRGWLRRGPLDLKVALEITLDVVRGLIYAQQKQPGLVHRDLKPENILVAQGGLAKITDFGLAQIVEAAGLQITPEPQTETSTPNFNHHTATLSIQNPKSSAKPPGGKIQNPVVGTPAYMAPEQWRGESLDERTDIYALGCILYELLTGSTSVRVAFNPATPQQFQQWLMAMQEGHESGPRPTPAGKFPAELNDLVVKCLAKARAERLSSLVELLTGLEQVYRQVFSQPSLPRPAADDFTAADYNNRGATYTNLKQYKAALMDYGRAIALDPNNAKAHTNRGSTYADLQQYEAALVDYSRAIEIDPAFAGAYYNRGTIYTDLQQYEAALADYSRAIEIDPAFALAYRSRGNRYLMLRQYEAALADFTWAINLNPNDVMAYYNRGNTYAALQQYEAALADYSRAIEIDPTNAKAYYKRGTMHQELQQLKVALVDYGQAIKFDPDYTEAYATRGSIYQELQRYEEAIADYSRAIQLDPTHSLVYFNRAITYRKLQRYEEALGDCSRVIKLDPTDALAYAERGFTYHELQQYEAALADYRRAIELNPTFALAYTNRGITYQQLQEYEAALKDYTEAIEIDPTLAQAYTNRGNVYQTLQQYEAALADFGRAIEIDPTLAQAYLGLGFVLVMQGKANKALPYLDKADQTGDTQVKQAVTRIRQALGKSSHAPQVDSFQQAFNAFQQAASPAVMRQAVARYPFMAQTDFLAAIEQIIVQQVSSEYRPYFEQRLQWLRQIAQEQNQ